MNVRSLPRPGGRSARVQAAVHQATRELLDQRGRAALTVPLIAARAGVTPSTVYRRWGDLNELLADVALEQLRPETPPADTGSVEGDLQAWAEQYFEEMSSVGMAMVQDVLSARMGSETAPGCACAGITAGQIAAIVERGIARGQAVPSVEAVMDGVVAPVVYRLLFGPAPATPGLVRAWVAACMARATVQPPAQATPAQPAEA
ncbi:TetR/AcrR family transcriptional regulator [Hylemonella gracilis]|uniref:TetR family transcriptional regulator n=1 Tax=Hylemonella gracilis ATCC 19624 TaxID=887062 RepID=F3KTJ8_9BURK|nr:TetR/AcrR family transcriptional regulator [Hylemonella gracilis]EGI76877.1 TetR family transcriptional regulator [Hylemonella gracilis ATCC 19624]